MKVAAIPTPRSARAGELRAASHVVAVALLAFGCCSLPAYLLAGDAGTVALAAGVAVAGLAPLAPACVRLVRGRCSRHEALLEPPLRIAACLAGVVVLYRLGLATPGAVSIVALTYPIFAVVAARQLVTRLAPNEARLT